MRFSILQTAVAGLALCTSAIAQLTAPEVVRNIRTLTMKSQDLQAPANSINLVNTPLIIVGQGPFPVSTNPTSAPQ